MLMTRLSCWLTRADYAETGAEGSLLPVDRSPDSATRSTEWPLAPSVTMGWQEIDRQTSAEEQLNLGVMQRLALVMLHRCLMTVPDAAVRQRRMPGTSGSPAAWTDTCIMQGVHFASECQGSALLCEARSDNCK